MTTATLQESSSSVSPSQKTKLSELPVEVLYLIFAHLDLPDLQKIPQICRLFAEILRERYFWNTKIATTQIFGFPIISSDPRALYLRPAKDNENKKELVREAKYFLDKVYKERNSALWKKFSKEEQEVVETYLTRLQKLLDTKDSIYPADKFFKLNNTLEFLNTFLASKQLADWVPIISNEPQVLTLQGITRLTNAYLAKSKNQLVQRLNLRNTGIKSFPQCFDMPSLQYLWLAQTQIDKIPPFLFQKPYASQLKLLELSHTKIKDLPEEISVWSKLHSLDITSLQLTTLPESFAKLSALTKFIYPDNKFIPSLSYPEPTALPSAIADMAIIGHELREKGAIFQEHQPRLTV